MRHQNDPHILTMSDTVYTVELKSLFAEYILALVMIHFH